ncbi:MAG: hypothetical protein ABI687_03575 [Flavitalea sp.]
MLEDKERLFIDYWELNRNKEKKLVYRLLTGLPVGLMFAVPVFLALFSSQFWFKRADMVAHSQLSAVVMILAGLLIAGFVALFYKTHQWEMKDQQYLEFKAKEKRGDRKEDLPE